MGRDLGKRVADRRAGHSPDGASGEEARPVTLDEQIRAMRDAFQAAMPRGGQAHRLVRDALTCLRVTPRLGLCEPGSVLGALMTCAQLGLRPAVLGHAWPLPFWDRDAGDGEGGYRARLVIGYQGYIELAYRSGRISSICARTRFSGDGWLLEYREDGDRLRHVPHDGGARGEPVSYYARALFRGGGYALTDPVSHADMEFHRDRYGAAGTREPAFTDPWEDCFEAMAHKTMIRRLAKVLPKSAELATALAADDGVRLDLDPGSDPAAVTGRAPGTAVPAGKEVISSATG